MIPIRHHQPLFTPVLIQTLPTLTWENLEERSRLEGVDPCFLRRADGLSDRSPEESFEEMRDVPTDRTSFLPASEPQPECSQPRVTATIMPNLKATPPMKITYKSLECYLWISSDRIVIAHHDGVPLLVYTASFQVKQAFVYHFGDKKDENSESVCIIGEKKIEIITSKGMFDYALPFEIGKVIPTPLCILIERASETDDFLSNTSSNLFTLTDTLVGVLPAILHKKGYTNEWYYPFDCEEVKVIGAEKDLLIVHDPTLETHLVYLIKKVEPDFWNTAAQVTEKETPISLRRFLLSPSKSLSASRQRSFRTPTTEQRTPGRGTEERGRLDFIQLLKQRRTPSVPDLGRTPVSAVSSFAESSMAGTSTMHQDTAFWPSHYPKIHEIEEYEFGDTLFDDYYGTNICIELLFSEKAVNAASTSAAAKKAFLTTDVIGIEYLALLIPVVDEQCELRLYNLGELRKGRISMEATMCKDASSLAEPGYMIVQDLNSNLQLHSGIKRLCLVALCAEPTRTDIFFQNGTDGFFWRSREYAWICNFSRFPMTFSNSLCKRIWDVLVQTVEPEKAISLISEIRSTLTPLQNVNEEIQRFLYLVNRHLGIKLSGDFWDPEFKLAISSPDVPRGGETEAKVPRPRRNLEDIARWALSYDLDPLTKASPTVKYEFLPNAFLSPDVQHILTALHTLYETIQLFKRKPPGFAFFMRNLYALNRALDCVDRAQIYASDDSNLRKIRFVTDNSQAIVKPAENLPLYVPAQIDILMQSRALTALPPNVSKDVAVVLLALATAYERVNLAGDLYQFLGNARKFFKDHPIGKSSLTSANFVSKTSLERLEFLLDEFPTILNFSSLSPMLEFLLKFKLFQLSENSRFLKIKKIDFQQPDGIASNEEGRLICRYRWPHDIRLFNVESLLDSSRPTFIPKRNHQNEADAREMSDQFVLTVAIRTMTLAFGIAALQLRSVRLYVNQPFIVPEICFSGRSFPENRPIELTIGDGLRSVRDWGDFYHGVSRGLSIRAADEHLISGEWIQNVFTEQSKPSATGAQAANNQNVKPSAASAGLLLGLGLNNHLPVLNIYNTHQMLASQDKFTSVALLLGYGASKIGTGDEQANC
ncbi:unnamed protein product, partial [Mesorhabditis belari]|uniref:Anaphase-promoting complex subunit 1 n=1 Tax=Mesorhabditis belari TaxID=2138241 RepID=A0AAF3EN43_9BILA